MIHPAILATLCCPVTRHKLVMADNELVALLNAKIDMRVLRNEAGKVIVETLDGGLLCEDGSRLYPIRQEIPLLVADEAILPGAGAPNFARPDL